MSIDEKYQHLLEFVISIADGTNDGAAIYLRHQADNVLVTIGEWEEEQ